MSENPAPLSRRDLFGRLFAPLREKAQAIQSGTVPRKLKTEAELKADRQVGGTPSGAEIKPKVAVIAGRHCLAYQGTPCSVCFERCPVPGAITMNAGIPRVEWAPCTGCGICHEVCPSPDQAVMFVDRPAGLGAAPTLPGGQGRGGFPFLPTGERKET